jgi:hypothetical protein
MTADCVEDEEAPTTSMRCGEFPPATNVKLWHIAQSCMVDERANIKHKICFSLVVSPTTAGKLEALTTRQIRQPPGGVEDEGAEADKSQNCGLARLRGG